MTDTIQSIDTSVDVMQSLLWQYNEALRLQSLLQSKQDWYDENQAGFWNDWYTDIFNLKTANSFGLSVWAIILQQPIIFNNVANPNKVSWGFGSPHPNFTRGNFAQTDGYTYILPKETARILLRLRYYQLTTAGTVPEINRMLKDVFSDKGSAYLLDGNNMTQLYIFGFEPGSDLRFIFDNFDILPRPAGVGSSYRIEVVPSWGFGIYHENFTNGNFFEG